MRSFTLYWTDGSETEVSGEGPSQKDALINACFRAFPFGFPEALDYWHEVLPIPNPKEMINVEQASQ